MLICGCEIEGFLFLRPIYLCSDMDLYASLQNIAEFFSLMWIIRIGGPACLDRDKDPLHHILLGIRDDPFNRLLKLIVFLFKEIALMEDHLCIFRIIKKGFEIRSQTLQDIDQRCDGRRCQIPFHLRDEALRQLRPVSQLLLRQILLYS